MIILAVWVVAVLTPPAAAAVAWWLMDPREPARHASPGRTLRRPARPVRRLAAVSIPDEPPTIPDLTIPMEPAA